MAADALKDQNRTRLECKETKEDKVEPVTEKIRIEPDWNVKCNKT